MQLEGVFCYTPTLVKTKKEGSIVDYRMTLALQEQDFGNYLAVCYELPGFVVRGDSLHDTLEKTKQTLGVLVESYTDLGWELPQSITDLGGNIDSPDVILGGGPTWSQVILVIAQSELDCTINKQAIRDLDDLYKSMDYRFYQPNPSETPKTFTDLKEQKHGKVYVETGDSLEHFEYHDNGLERYFGTD